MKPVGEGAVEIATISAPTKFQTEGHQASAGEVNGLISPLEETPSATRSVVQDGPAAPPNAHPGEPAMKTLAPLEKPASLQEEQHLKKPAVSSPDTMQPKCQAEGEHQPCLPTNGFSVDSSETSILSPSSLSDSDLLEAVLEGPSSVVPEKLMPEEPVDISVNVQVVGSPVPDIDINVTESSESNIMGGGKGETNNKISHLKETVGLETVREGVLARTSGQEEAESYKHSDLKSNEKTLSEGIQACDVPDGLESDLPSVSEAEPPSLNPKPKKQQSFLKRNKRKSNQGNLSINLNKDHVWNASLLMCLKGKSLFLLFLLHFTFYILLYGLF